MKILFAILFLLCVKYTFSQSADAPNVFIITTDGFRWQELFCGADASLAEDTRYVKDTGLLKQLFWSSDQAERRKMLMPFTWQVLAKKGSLYGNRLINSRVTIANPYQFSYAGYNEIFTGFPDRSVITNRKKYNRNENVLEFLNSQPVYQGKVAAFTSWNLFEYIFNRPGSTIHLNSGYQEIIHDSLSYTEKLLNGVQQYVIPEHTSTRNDMLTFITAREYIKARHPKVIYISFGETDEFAHHGRYDEYLQSAHMFDQYVAQLWSLVNSDPFYRNNTSFIITTDHGRGNKAASWTRHGLFTAGSNQSWLMMIGPGIDAAGEVKAGEEIYNEQLAQTIAAALGQNFRPAHPVADPVYSIINSVPAVQALKTGSDATVHN